MNEKRGNVKIKWELLARGWRGVVRNKTQNIIYDAGGQSPYTTRKCNCGEFTKYRLLMTVKPV